MKPPTKRVLKAEDVLRYGPKPVSRAAVRRHYNSWRSEHGLQRRCDMPECTFYSGSLVWNGKSLPLILDHISGNNKDNRPENLRLLCPNCDSQLETRGGANRGRLLEAEEGMFVLGSKDGSQHRHILPEGAQLKAEGYAPTVTQAKL